MPHHQTLSDSLERRSFRPFHSFFSTCQRSRHVESVSCPGRRRVRKLDPIALRGLAAVELEHAAEPRTAGDRACAD